MRRARGWTQEAFAAKVGTTQEVISRMEQPSYDHYTLTTLRRIAEVCGAELVVYFDVSSRGEDR